MMLWGKLLGAFFGYLLLGPFGMFLGVLLGHAFDNGVALNMQTPPAGGASQVPISSAFFSATFSIMGYLAKIDGRVNEQEIAVARQTMDRMQLSEEQRKEAMRFFREGKSSVFELSAALLPLIRAGGGIPVPLRHLFLEIQVQAVLVDGELHPNEYEGLVAIAHVLQVPTAMLDQLIARIQAMAFFSTGYRSAGGQQRRSDPGGDHRRRGSAGPSSHRPNALKEAYQVLGVSMSATDPEVKRAYRRLMSEHHPDKLVSKGLPPEMMRMATEKTQQIQQAYELVCRAREG